MENQLASSTSMTLEDQQIRFAWGYRNAQSDVKHARPNKWQGVHHFDENYKAGYLAGYIAASAGDNTEATFEYERDCQFRFVEEVQA